MFGPCDSVPFIDSCRVYNTIVLPHLEKTFSPDRNVYAFSYSFETGKAFALDAADKPSLKKAYARAYTPSESGEEIFESSLGCIEEKEDTVLVALLMTGPRGSCSSTLFGIPQGGISTLLGDADDVSRFNPWFSDEVLQKTFLRLLENEEAKSHLTAPRAPGQLLLVHHNDEEVTFVQVDWDRYERIEAEYLIEQDKRALAKKVFDSGAPVTMFVAENYVRLYPLIVVFEGDVPTFVPNPNGTKPAGAEFSPFGAKARKPQVELGNKKAEARGKHKLSATKKVGPRPKGADGLRRALGEQCRGLTQKKERCKKPGKHAGFCHLHAGSDTEETEESRPVGARKSQQPSSTGKEAVPLAQKDDMNLEVELQKLFDGDPDLADEMVPKIRSADPEAMRALLTKTIRAANETEMDLQDFVRVKWALLPSDRFDWSHLDEKRPPISIITLAPGALEQLSSVECFVLYMAIEGNIVDTRQIPNVWAVLDGAEEGEDDDQELHENSDPSSVRGRVAAPVDPPNRKTSWGRLWRALGGGRRES